MAGLGGFTIRLGLSELGPLTVQIEGSVPGGILLEPFTGLSINDFVGGVEFFKTLPSIDDPMKLRGPAFQIPTQIPADQWLATIQQQVAAQYLVLKNNPSLNGFTAAFTAPMTITGSAKLFTIYASEQVFNGQIILKISTDGKILIVGKLNFAADNLSVSGRLYADLSKVVQRRGHRPVPRRRARPGADPDARTAASRPASATRPARRSSSSFPTSRR